MIQASVRLHCDHPGARFELSSDETRVRAAWRPWQEVPYCLSKRMYPRSPERSLRRFHPYHDGPQAASSMGQPQPQHRQEGTQRPHNSEQPTANSAHIHHSARASDGLHRSDLTRNLDAESLWEMTQQERESVLRSDLKKRLDLLFEMAPPTDALPYRLYGCIDRILIEFTHTQILDMIHDGLWVDVVRRIDQEQARQERGLLDRSLPPFGK